VGTALWETYTRVADTGQPQTIEEIYVGEIVSKPTWLQLIVVPIGEDIAILAHDITDRKQAEEERRRSEERLKAAERMAHLGSWELDLVTNVLTWSDEIYRIFEIDPAQFGASYDAFLNAIHPDDRDAVNQAYSSSLETRTDYAIDHRLLMPDGRVKYVHEHCITLYDANGRALRSVGTVHDITERKRAEAALRKSEEEYRSLLQSVQVGVVVHGPDTSILFSNPQASQLLGLTPDQMRGKTAIDKAWCFIREDETSMPLEEYPVNQVLATNQPLTDLTLGILRLDREGPTWVQCNAHQDWDTNGNLRQVVVSFADITARKQAEEALQKSQARLKAAQSIGKIGDWSFDPVSEMFAFSDEMYVLFERDPLLGPPTMSEALACFHPADVEDVKTHFRNVLESGLNWEHDVQMLLPSSKLTWHHGTGIPCKNADGKVISIKGTTQDITARKQAEEALRESLAMLAQTESTAHVGSWAWDVATDTVLWSDELFRIFQLDPGRGAPSFAEQPKLFHPEDMQRLQQAVDIAIAGGAPYELEMRALRTDGAIRHCLARGRVVMNPEGKSPRLFGSLQDITERKQMEEDRARLSAEVRAQARQMAQILATVPTGVLLLDAAGQILQANTVAVGDLAVLAGVAVGDTLTRLGERPLAELLTSPPTKGVWHEVKANGRIFEVIARLLENDPGPEMWVLVIIDVTREREIQAQLQQQGQLAAVGQLAAGIAHDFNNIMAVIVLYTQLGLSMPDVPPKLRQRLEVILQQVHRATDLIQQILDFSRRAVLERRPLDLLLFLKEIVKLLERTLPESIRIELAYAQDDYTVGVDPTRIQQAIMNLATNARDAMLPQGGGKLRITLSRMAATDDIHCATCGQIFAGDHWVHIEVTDSGCGIPPEALSHIFEPFFTTKEVGKGTGLGLAQVYGILKQHEGHIDVVTEVGRGTTFNLYLPALPVQPPPAPARESEAPIQGQGETVLVVEDNAGLRDALASILELLNYRTLQAASGREALAVLERRADEIALVLSDLVMPEMGGQALFHAMRQRGLTLPVVILSGHPLESELEDLQAQGLAGWMLKPPSVTELGQLLARVLHKESEPG